MRTFRIDEEYKAEWKNDGIYLVWTNYGLLLIVVGMQVL